MLHAHFYQPERANPWTGALDAEPSAAPDRDWNARILRQCYHPNGSARIYDESHRVERIVNNYERISFNFGPTLLTWMERAHPRTYARVLDGDWRSLVRTGHGNALAQAYNHTILPLANARDRRTQVAWGIADFRHRFRREPQGMWLPETAADAATIDALIDAGIRFTVLAPHQARRVRPSRTEAWRDLDGDLDTSRAYRVAHSDSSGRTLAVFFYDGGLAQALAFDPETADAATLVERLAASPGDGLISAALDGETFGHHHAFGELGLAYALTVLAPQRGLEPTSYAAALAANPPTDEVELVAGEGTAWSCAHGVGRWYRDCGCSTGGEQGWNQRWRTPLRAALDRVRDAAAAAFEERGAELLRDPWRARDEYVEVRLGSSTIAGFLERHARRHLTEEQKVDARGLLEAQRHAMVMYTSCGWFFGDVGRIETVYGLRSAARVLGLLRATGAAAPTAEVLEILGEAQSNDPAVGTGADVWREQVARAEVSPRRIAAHTALLGLVRPLAPSRTGTGHVVEVADHRTESRGRVALTTCVVDVRSLTTGRRNVFAVAALHLGGLDFHGVAARDPDPAHFAAVVEQLWAAFPTAPMARLIRLVSELLDGEEFGLEQVMSDGRGEVVASVFSDLTARFREQYSRLYGDNRRVLEQLTEAGVELPRDLRVAAELTLSARLEQQLAAAVQVATSAGADVSAFEAVRATVGLAHAQGYELDLLPVARAVSDAVLAATGGALAAPTPGGEAAVERWLALAVELGVPVDFTTPQELVHDAAAKARAGRLRPEEVDLVSHLGPVLGLAPAAWMPRRD